MVEQGKLAQLRRLVREAVSEKPAPPVGAAETKARRAFQLYDFNTALPCIAQSPRARAEREIERIAVTYGWQLAVVRALDAARVTSLAGLDDDQVDQLADRMRRLVDCAMSACDPEDAPPAR